MFRFIFISIDLLTMSATRSLAENAVGARSLADVLGSSATHFPSILEAIAEQRAAAGRLVQSESAFDLVVSAETADPATGF